MTDEIPGFVNTEITLSLSPFMMHQINCEAAFAGMDAAEYCVALLRVKLIENDVAMCLYHQMKKKQEKCEDDKAKENSESCS